MDATEARRSPGGWSGEHSTDALMTVSVSYPLSSLVGALEQSGDRSSGQPCGQSGGPEDTQGPGRGGRSARQTTSSICPRWQVDKRSGPSASPDIVAPRREASVGAPEIGH